MGFITEEKVNFDRNFYVANSERSEFNNTWKPVWGTVRKIHDHYQQLKVQLNNSKSNKSVMNVYFRLYNDGVAFRYELLKPDHSDSLKIKDELTEFNLAEDFTTWWIPADFDSYELLYHQTPASQMQAVNTPITMKADDGIHISIHEAALTDYAEMTIKQNANMPLSFECDLVPWPDGIKVRSDQSIMTPWRMILIAPDAAGLVESNSILNLNEPCKIEDTSWIEPMKYVGIWWGMHIGEWTWFQGPRHGATTERTKQYIDFAAKHGIRGVLVEGWNLGWETWGNENIQDFTKAYDDFDLYKLARYAKEKGINLIGHHETGGNIPNYERQLEAAFDLYQRLGIKAVKTGYAGKILPEGYFHHGQFMVRHYRRVVEEAAERQIMIDAHEPIKDTGIRRTWPNMLSREGGRGMEYNAWSEGNPPEHTTILPFTRLLGGPMDYTPGIFNIMFDKSGVHRVHTTLAKQLALWVVLYSPVQMAADLIENYENKPAFKFFRDLPIERDTTIVLNAEVGDFISIAYKHGDQWYLGSITDEEARLLKIPLSFLRTDVTYHVELYADAYDTDININPTAIEIGKYYAGSADTLVIPLSPGGGMAARILPISMIDALCEHISKFNLSADKKMRVYGKIKNYDEPTIIEHLGRHGTISLNTSYHPKYPAGGDGALIDGITGDIRSLKYWQGFEATDFDAEIDLGSIVDLNSITVYFLRDYKSWIFLPENVIIQASSDDVNYLKLGEFDAENIPHENEAFKAPFSVSDVDGTYRFIKITAKNINYCPDWHSGAGGKAWLMADEIIIQ